MVNAKVRFGNILPSYAAAFSASQSSRATLGLVGCGFLVASSPFLEQSHPQTDSGSRARSLSRMHLPWPGPPADPTGLSPVVSGFGLGFYLHYL